MVSPQTENGHIDIANELAEALARTRISGEEWQVLWVIIRKTYGWHKKEDAISLSQFNLFTNMLKPSIVRSIRKLMSKRLIIVNKNVNKLNPNIYRFNKHYDEWKPLSKKTTTFNPVSTLRKYCYICGYTESIEKHHIIPIMEGGTDSVKNKITLCPNCHTSIHKGSYTAEELLNKKDQTENNVDKNVNQAVDKNVTHKRKSTTKEKEYCYVPYQEIVDLFHQHCPSLPKVKDITDGRKLKMKARWNKYKTLDAFMEIFKMAEASDFLTFRTSNKTNWKCNFDWLFENEGNMVKVLEGQYSNKNKPTDFYKDLD